MLCASWPASAAAPDPFPLAQNELQLQKEKVRRKAAIVARQEEELAARDAAADEEQQRARGLQRELERATEDAGVREWDGSERIQVCARERVQEQGVKDGGVEPRLPVLLLLSLLLRLGNRMHARSPPLLACAQRRCARRWGSCGGGWRTAAPRWPATSR